MSAQKDLFTITREEAASKLGISLRTLDRYLKKGKLKSKSDNRVVLINSQSLANLAKKLGNPSKTTPQYKMKKGKSAPNPKKEIPIAETVEVAAEDVEEKVFRELYEEASRDLKSKQEKLEAASFRVGQLEAQLKNSVPLLEYKQKEAELGKESAKLKEKLVAAILKSWVFLGLAIGSGILAIIFAALLFI